MTRSRVIAVAAALIAGIAVLLLWPREPESPEELIKQKVIQMGAAAEEKDVGFIIDQISDTFVGTHHKLDKEELRRFLTAQMFRGEWVRVFTRDMNVELISPSRASFQGKFIFGRSQADTLEKLAAQSQIQAYEIQGELVKEEDGEWRFVTANYKVIPAGQLF